jgi:hypothetical protein
MWFIEQLITCLLFRETIAGWSAAKEALQVISDDTV